MLSFVLTALAASSAVIAQSSTSSGANSQCTQNAFTISSAVDLQQILGCQNISGDVSISPTLSQINLGNIQRISGSLSIINNSTGSATLAAVNTLIAPSLQSIGGIFSLTELTQLSSLQMGALTSVGGLAFTTLPVLQQLGFGGGITQARSILITDTQLQSLNGITLRNADTIVITNNRYLQSITMSQLSQVGGSLTVSSNAPNVAVSFPALTNCGNITMQQIGNLSIDGLANVTGSMGLQQNTFTQISAANLTMITQDLFITNNTQLMNITMPKLQTVSGFQIANNTNLNAINYPALTTVAGAVDLSGSFDNVTLASLKDVRGGLNVQSSSSSFSCPANLAQGSGVVKGKGYVCQGKVAAPQKANGTTVGSTGTTGSTASGTSTAKSSGVKVVGTQVAAMSGVVALVFAFMF